MKDNYGDKIDVQVHGETENVYLGVRAYASYADASLSPAKARKLAKKLRRAADEVDGGAQVTFDDVKESFLPASYYMLDLTQAEAETLAVILYRVGGQPDSTPRGYVDTVRAKLSSLGLDAEVLNRRPQFAMEAHAASLYFENRA